MEIILDIVIVFLLFAIVMFISTIITFIINVIADKYKTNLDNYIDGTNKKYEMKFNLRCFLTFLRETFK